MELSAHQADSFDIVVPITSNGIQLLCTVVDNVEALVDEWFPGLRDLSVYSGEQLIKSMSLCPLCPCKWNTAPTHICSVGVGSHGSVVLVWGPMEV